MNPSSNIKSKIEERLKINPENRKIEINDNINFAGNTYSKLNTYNAVQMASLEITKIDSTEVRRKKNTFYYYSTDNLDKDFSKVNKGKIIHICIYSVTISDYKPFLQYLLYKNEGNNSFLSFPFFKFKSGNLEDECDKRISKITSEKYQIQGYKKYNDDIFIIVSLPDNSCVIQNKKKESVWWFALLSEIINEQRILYFPIHKLVNNFFYNTPELLYLLDDENLPYETPIGLYNGQIADKTNFIAKFGISKFSPLASMGPFYYFSTYKLACKFGSWSYNFKPQTIGSKLITDNEFGRYKKGGIVRFAIFTGKLLMFMNRPWDVKDTSILSANRSDKEKRLLDMDSKWAENYDSTCISEIVFSDGSRNQIGAKYCVKNYYQQVPLTYHFIDKSSVPSMYNDNAVITIE